MKRTTEIAAMALTFTLVAALLHAQDGNPAGAVVKGKVEFDENRLESWDGEKLVVPFTEITTQLFEKIKIPPVPVPQNWETMKPEERQKWAVEYEASDEGKTFIENRDKIIDEAHSFDVKIEGDGKFVVFDVPAGVYGLQGRIDKEIGSTSYGFEVFGEITVETGVDELLLDPIQIAVTPLLKAGSIAPPIMVETYDGKTKLTSESFQDHYLFVDFWITNSPSAEYQTGVQNMFRELKTKYPIKLLSICVDEDRESAFKFMAEKQLQEGSQGYTDGLDHRTLFDFGVRAIPSFWLIAPDGTISMTNYDFARAFRANPDLNVIVSNRIEGKEQPTPAVPTEVQPEAGDPDSKK
jgi:hypothetical protein